MVVGLTVCKQRQYNLVLDFSGRPPPPVLPALLEKGAGVGGHDAIHPMSCARRGGRGAPAVGRPKIALSVQFGRLLLHHLTTCPKKKFGSSSLLKQGPGEQGSRRGPANFT